MSVTNVYQLLPMLDTPGYRCFGIEDAEPLTGDLTLLRDFFPRDLSKRPWQMQRLAALWQPRRVINPLPGQLNDFPCIGLRIPTFSRRAVSALRDLLEPNGELLPLVSDEGPDAYWAYNTTTVADVLDRERSDIEWPPLDRLKIKKEIPVDLVVAREIHHYEFHVDRLTSLSIFRLVEMSQHVYVTETFAQRIREHDLKGFNLRQVFPCRLPQYSGPGHW